jgi:pimeloyl-ACP methyl ester carboxylesterase
MRAFPAFFTATRILLRLLRSSDGKSNCEVQDDVYPGRDGQPTPYRKFIPRRSNGEWLILFPGASPYGEQHPAMNQLSLAVAGAGFTVIIPRIPPLMALEIDPNIMDWMQHAYQWLMEQRDEKVSAVRIVGTSFGGPLILGGLQFGPLHDYPPDSFMMYGPYYDIQSVLDYLCTGTITYQGRTWTQPVHEWGLVVFFHNYLSKIDPGYPVARLRHLLSLRVKDDEDGVAKVMTTLEGPERSLAEALLSGTATPEVRRFVEKIREACAETFQQLSPSTFADRTPVKVYIIHGRSDTMVPFTESLNLAKRLPDARLLITSLYEHSEMSGGGTLVNRVREAFKILFFLIAFLTARKPS